MCVTVNQGCSKPSWKLSLGDQDFKELPALLINQFPPDGCLTISLYLFSRAVSIVTESDGTGGLPDKAKNPTDVVYTQMPYLS